MRDTEWPGFGAFPGWRLGRALLVAASIGLACSGCALVRTYQGGDLVEEAIVFGGYSVENAGNGEGTVISRRLGIGLNIDPTGASLGLFQTEIIYQDPDCAAIFLDADVGLVKLLRSYTDFPNWNCIFADEDKHGSE